MQLVIFISYVTVVRPELFKRATQTFGSEPDCQIRANSTSAPPLLLTFARVAARTRADDP